jgi:hypothetical protein
VRLDIEHVASILEASLDIS